MSRLFRLTRVRLYSDGNRALEARFHLSLLLGHETRRQIFRSTTFFLARYLHNNRSNHRTAKVLVREISNLPFTYHLNIR